MPQAVTRNQPGPAPDSDLMRKSQRQTTHPTPPGWSPKSTNPCTTPSVPHPVPTLSLSKRHTLIHLNPSPQKPLDPFPIQATIQRHILTITDNGLTLLASLAEIARGHDDPRACPEPSRRIKTSHRQRAARILIDRLAGTDLLPAHSAVLPRLPPKVVNPRRLPHSH